MEGREEGVVCMGPQLEMSRSVRGHRYHLLPALSWFFSTTAQCVCLTQTGDKARSPGERVKEPVFQNREDCDALSFRLCCVLWASCAKGTQHDSLADHLVGDGSCYIQHLGVFLPSAYVLATPSSLFLQLLPELGPSGTSPCRYL